MHFGGHPRKKPKIIKPKGEDPTLFARHESSKQFQIMLWAVIGPYGDEIPFPYWIYEQETEESKKEAQTQLNKLNSTRKHDILTRQFRAGVSDTVEYKALREINANIADYNHQRRA